MSAWSQRGSLSHASLVAGQCFSVTASRQTSWPWQWMRRPHRPRGSSTRRYTSRRVSPPRPYGQLSALTSVPHSPSASHSSPTAAWSHPGSWFASSSEAGHSACEARLRQTVLSPQWWNSRSQPHRGSTTVGREAAAAASCCCRRASSSIAPAVIGSVGGALRVHGAPGGSGGDGGAGGSGGGAGGVNPRANGRPSCHKTRAARSVVYLPSGEGNKSSAEPLERSTMACDSALATKVRVSSRLGWGDAASGASSRSASTKPPSTSMRCWNQCSCTDRSHRPRAVRTCSGRACGCMPSRPCSRSKSSGGR
mmetsp:Transcript_31762/g.101319  ORF Transcript_31762/g.101319 Transcript_31762/m.101319 type:complete len:309 (-) Transcript_31762:1784-2710(-)